MKSKKAKTALSILEEVYGNRGTELNYSSDFLLLIAVILSAQCTDKRVNLVTKKLFKELDTPEDFANVETAKLEKLIFSTGFYKNKAKNIIACSKEIVKRGGQLPKTIEELTNLAGVGRKTANVVLSELHGISEGVVVDTHIFRVSTRLGITKGKTPEQVEKELMNILDKKDWIKYGNIMIQHGRTRCKSRKPDCENCEVKNICSFYKSNS